MHHGWELPSIGVGDFPKRNIFSGEWCIVYNTNPCGHVSVAWRGLSWIMTVHLYIKNPCTLWINATSSVQSRRAFAWEKYWLLPFGWRVTTSDILVYLNSIKGLFYRQTLQWNGSCCMLDWLESMSSNMSGSTAGWFSSLVSRYCFDLNVWDFYEASWELYWTGY